MRLWFSETLMGGITQALFTLRGASCCCQAWGAAAPAWAGLAPWGGHGAASDPKTPEWGGMPGQLHLGWVCTVLGVPDGSGGLQRPLSFSGSFVSVSPAPLV